MIYVESKSGFILFCVTLLRSFNLMGFLLFFGKDIRKIYLGMSQNLWSSPRPHSSFDAVSVNSTHNTESFLNPDSSHVPVVRRRDVPRTGVRGPTEVGDILWEDPRRDPEG